MSIVWSSLLRCECARRTPKDSQIKAQMLPKESHFSLVWIHHLVRLRRKGKKYDCVWMHIQRVKIALIANWWYHTYTWRLYKLCVAVVVSKTILNLRNGCLLVKHHAWAFRALHTSKWRHFCGTSRCQSESESLLSPSTDCRMQIILLGDSAVGKSKLVERYMMNEFQPRQVLLLVFPNWLTVYLVSTALHIRIDNVPKRGRDRRVQYAD